MAWPIDYRVNTTLLTLCLPHKTITRSTNSQTSPISQVISRMVVRVSRLGLRNGSKICARTVTSRALVGFTLIKIFGLQAISAIVNRCRWTLDN